MGGAGGHSEELKGANAALSRPSCATCKLRKGQNPISIPVFDFNSNHPPPRNICVCARPATPESFALKVVTSTCDSASHQTPNGVHARRPRARRGRSGCSRGRRLAFASSCIYAVRIRGDGHANGPRDEGERGFVSHFPTPSPQRLLQRLPFHDPISRPRSLTLTVPRSLAVSQCSPRGANSPP
jgi:hypothetical protein